jgi:hypothetical protein
MITLGKITNRPTGLWQGIGTANQKHLASWSNGSTPEIREQIAKALSEHAALVAVAEKAKIAEKWFHASTEDPYGTCYRSTCRSEDIAELQIALANLAAVIEGGAK